jgi:uncharacterized protein
VLLAMTSLDRLRRADRFGPWLAGIGLNVCRRWLREQARAAWSWEAVQGGLAGYWPVRDQDPAELAEAADDRPERNVVLLDEVDGDRHLQVWVGPWEGVTLAMVLRGVDLPRPLTFRFAAGLLAATGATLREVRVTRLVEGTFYAEAVVDGLGGDAVVDARPSDALSLALLTGSPIRVDPAVLEMAEASPIPWGELPEQLPADSAKIVSDRLTDWKHSREAMARAREQGAR